MNVANIPATFESVRTRVYPRVGQSEGRVGFDLVPGRLSVSLVLDGVEGPRAVDDRDLRGWGKTFEAVLSESLDNLRRKTRLSSFQPVRTAPGLYAWLGDDGLGASRALILRDLVRPWPLAGALIAMPSPDQLLVLAISELSALDAVSTLAQTALIAEALGSKPVTEDLFWHDGITLQHVPVVQTDDDVELDPPRDFLLALRRVAALEMSGPAAEA
jgi:hypothetical protein